MLDQICGLGAKAVEYYHQDRQFKANPWGKNFITKTTN
jgi:hypothetical protein